MPHLATDAFGMRDLGAEEEELWIHGSAADEAGAPLQKLEELEELQHGCLTHVNGSAVPDMAAVGRIMKQQGDPAKGGRIVCRFAPFPTDESD
eukprot:gene29675-47974_t